MSAPAQSSSPFYNIAEPLAKMGVPVTPVRAGTKRAFLPDFPTTATTDLNQINAWGITYQDANVACVARAEVGGIWLWEVDSIDVAARLKKDTGHDISELCNTFRVRSRPGRGHFYFRHNAASMAMGNISQTYVIGGDWSVRAHREYVVGPGSIHPDTQKPYEALNWGADIIEAPQWLIDWLLSQKIQKTNAPKETTPLNAQGRIPHGAIHGWMLTQAGRLRNAGLTQDEIETALLRMVHEQCEPPIDDEKVRAMAKSICNYEPGKDTSVALNIGPTAAAPAPVPVFELSDYPKFPRHIMFGTSIYEGFVKPYCEVNARVDYFMWAPAAAMMMNYLGGKVSVPYKGWKPSFYIVLIGRRSATKKSSSIKDGMAYLEHASALEFFSKNIKMAEGKSIVWEAGSPEGLGTDMQRINCKNAIWFYDELRSLVQKASIQGSGIKDALLKMYESANFANSIKGKKDTFSIAPDTYTASLITSTTLRAFGRLWGLLSDDADGLESRFTFLLEPAELPEKKPQQVVGFMEAAKITKSLMERAVNKGTYSFFDQTPFIKFLDECGEDDRIQIRAEKWALYFAIDLGLDEIDEDCVARGIEMSRYEIAVKSYLKMMESKSELAALQQDMVRKLNYSKGVMSLNKFKIATEAKVFDTFFWAKALYGLQMAGHVNLNDTTVTLIRGFEDDDEDDE